MSDDLRKRIRRKEGLVPRSRADRYLHHFDGIWHLQTLLLSEADQLGIPIVNSTDRESAILGATTVIMEALAGEFSVDIETVFGPATVGETADHETTQGAAAEQTD